MSALEVFLLILVIVILIVVGVFTAISAYRITQVPNYSNDQHLYQGFFWIIIATVTAWFSFVILGLLIIIYFLVRSHSHHDGNNFSSANWVRFFLIILFIGILAASVVATIGVIRIRSSSAYQSSDTDAESAFNNAIVAVVVGYVGAILALATIFLSFRNQGTSSPPVIQKQAAPNTAQQEIANELLSGKVTPQELAEAEELAPLLA